MATSADIYNQIQQITGQLNPMLNNQAGVSNYFTEGLNKAMNYNLPALKNAANIQAKLYSMPSTLMNQYNADFGGQTGVDSSARIANILSQIGSQSGLANVASGLATQAGTNIKDIAKNLTDQYNTQVEALQTQLNPLMSIWDRMYAEEQANKRARGSGSGGVNWDAVLEYFNNQNKGNTNTTTTTNTPAAATVAYLNSLNPANQLQKTTATTASPEFNKLVNNRFNF